MASSPDRTHDGGLLGQQLPSRLGLGFTAPEQPAQVLWFKRPLHHLAQDIAGGEVPGDDQADSNVLNDIGQAVEVMRFPFGPWRGVELLGLAGPSPLDSTHPLFPVHDRIIPCSPKARRVYVYADMGCFRSCCQTTGGFRSIDLRYFTSPRLFLHNPLTP